MSIDQPENMEKRESHYERFLGPLTEPIMHSTDFTIPHIDIYQFRPTEERPYWTLITGGMSDFPQPGAPDDISPRAELLLYASKPENWMISVLKGLAEMPFKDDTYLYWYHTVPNGMPMTAKPSLLTNFFFLPAYFEKKGFDAFSIEGEEVRVLWMFPITDAELKFKLKRGGEALDRRFADKNASPVIDESRSSFV